MMFNCTYKVFVVIIFSLFLVACGAKKKEANRQQQKPVAKLDAYIVKAESYSEAIEVPGSIVANEVVEIHPEVSGRIVRLNVAEGRQAGKGALLAKIYDGDQQAQLRKLQSQLAIAKNNEDRASQLLKIEGISKNDYDATLLNLNNIRADIDVIRAEISKTEVRAPFSGKLGLKNISPGAYVTPVSVIATINQLSDLKLDFSIPERYTGNLYNDQAVNFTVQGSDQVYTAKIFATASNVQADNRSLMVRARVIGKTGGLIPGSFAKVKLGFAPHNNSIFVPSRAIVPTARSKQVILYRNGKALFNDVQIGARDSARVAITTGLKVGDTVLVTGMMTTRPDATIEIGKIVSR